MDELVSELMQVTHMSDGLQDLVDHLMGEYSAFLPQHPLITTLLADVRDEARGEIASLCASIGPQLQNHLTISEIRALRDFFGGPLGQKWLKTVDAIDETLLKLGTDYADAVSAKIESRYRIVRQELGLPEEAA